MRNRTKILLGLAVLAMLGYVVITSQQARIGSAMMERAISQRVGLDASAALPDGLHIALCGTGSPLPSPVRAGPCNVIIAGKQIFVVDAGEGSARNITQMGLSPGRIDGLLLTHFHSDHIDGMGPLLMNRWVTAPNRTPLPIYGANGVADVVAGFNAAYAQDNQYRTAHHGAALAPPGGAGGRAMPFALPEPGKGDNVIVLENDGLTITAFRVDHGPISPAVGYRFDYKGRSIVISGDTKKSSVLIAAAKDADLLVHEALQPKLLSLMTNGFVDKNIDNLAQISRDIVNYHATPEEAAESAQAAGVRQLVLSHIVPSIPSAFFYPAFLGDAPSRFDGPIIMGEDGMIFTLPAKSQAIDLDRLM